MGYFPQIYVEPTKALEELRNYILADGFDFILDLEKSRGALLLEARTGKPFIDFFTCFASMPIGMNHPKMMDEHFINYIGRIAVNKIANSDIYTDAMATFVKTFFEYAVPDYFKYSFFIEGGALAVTNALKVAFDWKVQKNFRKGDLVEINLEAPVTVCTNPDGSISLRKGSLLLALRLKEIYQPLKGREPFNYRQYVSGGAWNYAPLLREGKAVVLAEKRAAIPPMPFDPEAPPLIVTVKGVEVLNWKEKQHSAGQYPTRPELGTPVNLEMVPYGCTNIRMAQFPMIKEA